MWTQFAENFNLIVVFIILSTFLHFCITFWNGRTKLPPGPWGLPLVGHLIFLGLEPHKTLLRWKKMYGPIIYSRVGSYPVVFLCDQKIIKQAFGLTELSGRADLNAIVDATNTRGIVLSEGPRQAEQRQFALKAFKQFGVGSQTIEQRIQEATCQFLGKLERSKGNAVKNFHIASDCVISSLCSILMTDSLSAEDVHEIHSIVERAFSFVSIGSTCAIFMPWVEVVLKCVTFGRTSMVKERQDNVKQFYDFVQDQVTLRDRSRVKNESRDIIDIFLDTVDKTRDVNSCFHPRYNSLPFFVTELLSAGVHTTSLSIEWLLLYLAMDPSVQQKLAEEIDSVVGPFRLPTLSNRRRLPWVDAAIYEVIRLSSIAPLGIGHKCLKEIYLKDFRIPKGTLVYANLYGVHHDPDIWGPDVEEFNPERWLGYAGKKLKSNSFLAFSTGKRKCIGETLAQDTVFLVSAAVLQRFTVSLVKRCLKAPSRAGSSGVILSPEPFEVIFKPRHAG